MIIKQKINKTALFIAATSFLLGTLLFVGYIITDYNRFIDIGFLYVIVAFALNGITLIGLLGNAIINRHQAKENILTMGMLLLNLPIACLYFFIIFGLLS